MDEIILKALLVHHSLSLPLGYLMQTHTTMIPNIIAQIMQNVSTIVAIMAIVATLITGEDGA